MSDDVEQDELFEVEDSSSNPERRKLIVHFLNEVDRQAFSNLVGQVVSSATKVLHYPFVGSFNPTASFDAEAEGRREALGLFEMDEPWKDTWRGMPQYSHKDLEPFQSVEVYFDNFNDQQTFAQLIGNSVSKLTKSVWFPKADHDNVIHLRWQSTRPQLPKYPIYVPTKGRWESAFTIKCMETLGIPYFAVVQPQEEEKYKPVVKTGTMLLLPAGLDGLVPTRNWIMEHSIATGVARHWQLDDNIKSYFRYHENRQIHVADGTCLRIVEDFADRYTNLAIAGCQYFMFIARKVGGLPPYVFNTRVYSNSLINNRMPYRYRDVYNDDTDICLRALKDGWCTVQFNAFLAWKQPTMVVKGGNTPIYLGAEKVAAEWAAHAASCGKCSVDESPVKCEEGRAILQKDGRWRMAESLRRQHPDVTTITRKWDRWQHQVDYRRFKENIPIYRPDFVLPEGQDDYGLELVEVGKSPRQPRIQAGKKPREAVSRPATPAPMQPARPSGPSALDFIKQAAAAEPAPAPPRVEPPAVKEAPTPAPKPAAALPFQDDDYARRKARPLSQIAREDGFECAVETAFERHPDLTRDEVVDLVEASIKFDEAPGVGHADGIDPVDPKGGGSDDSVAGREVPSTGTGQEAPSTGVGAGFLVPAADQNAERTSANDSVMARQPGETGTTLDPATLEASNIGDPSRQSAGQEGDGVSPPQDDGDGAGVSRPSVDDAERTSSPVITSPLEEDVKTGGYDEPAPRVTSLFEEPRQGQSLAEFLGTAPPRAEVNYVPDEPPDLLGIDEVVLNFATNGLDWLRGNRPVGLTVSTMDGKLCRFLPFGFAGGNLNEAAVKRWAQEQLRGKKITNSKTKFDVHMAREWGVDLEAQGCTFSDVQHTAALLDDHRKRFSIDVLAADYLPDLPPVVRVDESRHHEHHAAEVVQREKHTAELVWRLRDAMRPELEKQELLQVQALEDEVIPAVVEMERNGSPIDMELLEQFGRDCTSAYEALMMEVSREAGFVFEHTASGWKRLIESLHLTPPDSFAEASLNEVDHPLIRKGQHAAQYASLNSKIFKAYPKHIVDGTLRYDINQLVSDEGGTVSGRFSIGIVQQVPNKENHEAAFGHDLFPRRLFIPGKGALGYLEADAEQIEQRILVHYSQNKKLLQAYKDNPRMSFHKEMWAMLKTYKPDMLYVHTKSYNFASAYGARSIKLATMMGFITEREGDEIRRAKRWDDPRLKLIKEIEAAYQQAHPEARALLDRASHLAKPACDDYCKRGDALHRQYAHRGYVKTIDGRRSRFNERSKHYISLNRIIQGSGASIMKRKLKELHDARKATGFVLRITNHDAALGDALAPDTRAKVAEILDAQSYPLTVPILWACKEGPNWGAAS